MEIREQKSFFVGDWQVSPDEDTVSLDGRSERLEPLAMQVLVYLASRAGEVVSRSELEQAVWKGAVVSYDSITSTVIKLRKALGDSSRHPRFIATIPKRGYQLIATVSFRLPEEDRDNSSNKDADATPWAQRVRQAIPLQIAVISLASAIIIAVLLLSYLRPTAPLQESVEQVPQARTRATPSIVVLPFENLSDDPRQESFADGITEDIITDLSGFSKLLVIASNTSFSFKDMRVDPREIAEELNVDFVLEGSIRRIGNQIRVNAQLVDARTGFQKWANRYDRQVAEVFSVQDELTGSIIDAMAVELSSQEENRFERRDTHKLAAYDNFVEAQRLARLGTKEANIQAQTHYRSAIETDPNYGRAYGALAYALAQSVSRRWSDAPIQTIDRALELAKKAVDLDRSSPHTYWSLGYVHLARSELAQAQAAASQSTAIAPNFADGYALQSLIKNGLGEPEAALELIRHGMQLNPNHAWNYSYSLGVAYFGLGRVDEAIAALEDARSKNTNALPVRALLAASYMKAERPDDADWEVVEMQAINPASSIARFRHSFPIKDEKLVYVILESLRAAGLPE